MAIPSLEKQDAVSLELVRSLLSYDPETGVFLWKGNFSMRIKAGDRAGAISGGHRRIQINGKKYLSARLAWFYTYGEWPEHEIDHINRKRDDDRIANLRPATSAENGQNKNLRKDSITGVTGVSRRMKGRKKGKYIATLHRDGKKILHKETDAFDHAVNLRRFAEVSYRFDKIAAKLGLDKLSKQSV